MPQYAGKATETSASPAGREFKSQGKHHADGETHKDLQGLNIALDLKQQELELVSPAHFSPSAWFRD